MTYSYTTVILISEELQVEKSTATPRESGQYVFPTGLLLVC